MTCPSCQASVSMAPVAGSVSVCPECARSVVIDGDTARLAVAADLADLTAGEITQLRQARPAAWRNDVRARHAQIVAGR